MLVDVIAKILWFNNEDTNASRLIKMKIQHKLVFFAEPQNVEYDKNLKRKKIWIPFLLL